MTGHVSLVGAGPGDPGLLTRKAIARLRAADLVLYDALVDEGRSSTRACCATRGARRNSSSANAAPAARARRASLRAPQRERAGVGPREQ